MNPQDIIDFVESNYADIATRSSWGETSLFVNPEHKLKFGAYFSTIKEQNGENDQASNLDREGIFRLNMGLSKQLFAEKFGARPLRPRKGGIIEGPWDFTKLDEIMPHPIYGWMGWICVLNPSNETFDAIKPLLADAFKKARQTCDKRIAKLPQGKL